MANNTNLIIDGSYGEGGGSILRLAAAFSVLYNKSVRIKNIRANRSKPGLRMQHLLGIKTLAAITNSYLTKCEIGTKDITISPQNGALKDQFEIDVSTAASIGLLLQPIQIACLKYKQPEMITLNINGGGTFGQWAPSLNYLTNVTYPIYNRIGLSIRLNILKNGFYPKGGAKVICYIQLPKAPLNPIELTRLGKIDEIDGEIIISTVMTKSSSDIANRIEKTISKEINKILGLDSNLKIQFVDTLNPGVGLCLWAHSDTNAIISTGTVLGEKNITSEKLGKIACNEIIKYIENEIPVDNYLSDQLIPFMANIERTSRIRVLEVTSHAKTNLDLIHKFIDRKYNIIKDYNSYIIEFESKI